jgi:tetratricopeptide (TPR) repeat protein
MRFVLVMAVFLGGCGVIGMSRDADVPEVSERMAVARANQEVGDFVEAARLYELELEANPGSAPALAGLGETLTASGQFNRADQVLSAASLLHPRDVSLLLARGELELSRKSPRVALSFFDQVLARDRGNLRGILGRGVSLDYLSLHSDAQIAYLAGLSRYPSHFGLQNNYGLSLILSNEIDRGLGLLEDLFRTPDRGEAVRVNLALGYYLSDRRDDARALLDGVMDRDQIERELSRFEEIQKNFLSGDPIGYLVFN